ncbi:GmrSD restriction endonuclease domain-containing protein [Streptomyces aidingensis]|uniref:DUF262 domain-containing protein n=1 Tax=Streptomyces aidingensis TaxID=910347 RepID=A0A1I1URI7_9ACTN|nr:DUF262 domain-containing protein [Streptomyces aidingensis]SFD73309.1 hypothetical protein SAMN05421773_12627 [Streptomyces aidingensis]
MAQARYKNTSYPVSRLVEDIQRGEIALPDLQRPYVWPAAKARDLFDSMYKGFPVGYLLFWETGADVGARQIGTGDGRQVARHLIVDGQQRLTSLYAVMTGASVTREDYSTGRIRLAFRPADATFAVTDAAVEQDPEYLPDISELWKPENRKRTVRAFLRRLGEKRELDDDERDQLDTALDRVYELAGYTFRVVELAGSMSEDEVAEIFVRINSKGVALNQADFILTLMSVFWEKGRRELEDFCRAAREPSNLAGPPSPFNWFIQPHPSQLLRVTTTVALRRAVLKHVYTALRGRSLETGKPDPARREEQFAKLQKAQRDVLDLTHWHEFLQCLERAGFRGTRMISAENAVLYSYVLWLIGRVEHRVPIDRLREVIARWFFMAHMTGRYSGSFESRMEHDLTRLTSAAQDGRGFAATLDKIIDDTLSRDFWEITLPNELDSSAAKSPALMAYIAALNILDADALLSTAKVRSRLDPALMLKKGIERHHLFPRNYLKGQGIKENTRINQIANMALVEWSDNIAISDTPPAEYWPRQLARRNLAGDRLERQRHWHALPPGWEHMPYAEFLAARRTLMAAVVRDAFRALSDRDYRPVYPQPGTPAAATSTASGGAGAWVALSDLLASGLLAPGTPVVPRQGVYEATGEIDAEGNIVLDGERYDSPSGAARALGSSANGWTFWRVRTREGLQPLDDLRQEYRARLR